MQEHDFEPTPGLPQALPGGEQILWQGSASAESLARHTFHVRKLALYFIALLALRIVLRIADGMAFADAVAGSIGLAVLAGGALTVLLVYARAAARRSMFTVTSKRIVVRCGLAVPVTVNLPFASLESADLRLHNDGSGDFAIRTEANSRVSYVLLWPFVKPWRWMRVQPVLRGVPDAEAVSTLISSAFAEHLASDQPVPVEAEEAPRAEPRRWRPYPTIPLAAAASLIVIALVAVAWMRITGEVPGMEQSYEIAASVDLVFEDREDGAVVVIAADSGDVIDTLEPGTNGFVRGALRSFARHRRTVDAGTEVPFSIRRTSAGRLLIHDLATGQEIDLRAFGETNAGAFERFLDIATVEPVAMDAEAATDDSDVVALTRQEAIQ